MYCQEVSAMPTGQRAAVARRRERGGRRGTERCYPGARTGYRGLMLTRRLTATGLRGWHLHAASLGSIGLCIGLWIRAKTVDQDERGNAERRALFVGLWPPMFWLIGDSVEGHERRGRRWR
jgi:hypothetical protein